MRLPKHTNPSASRRSRAPYNFVPAPEVVVPAPALPLHDSYDPQRHSGVIHCTLTTATPLYTRSALEPNEYGRRQAKDKPEFFYVDPDTKLPVIPGSSLRGVLRTLVEIITYSKLQPVTNRQLFFRTMDGSSVMHAYSHRVGFAPGDSRIRGGIFYADGEKYEIQPCLVARARYDENSEPPLLFGQRVWTGAGPQRMPNWDLQHKAVWVKLHADATRNLFWFQFADKIRDRQPTSPGFYPGTLVITGWAPKKRGEFVFVETRESRIEVDERFVQDFESDDQISQWQGDAFPLGKPAVADRSRSGGLRNGEPVFYMIENGRLIFGRAGKFRLPYAHAPVDMLPNYGLRHAPLPIADVVDMAEAMFGRVDEQASIDAQIAGRIAVGDAHVAAVGEFGDWAAPEGGHLPKVLNSPKPTAVQHYLTQDRPESEKTLRHYDDSPEDTTLRGHKLYWHKQENLATEMWAEPEGTEPGNLHTGRIRPVAAGVTFAFNLWFENLADEELGALLWMLKMASHDRYRLHLGLGKPYGLGTACA